MLTALKRNGIAEVVIVVGFLGEKVESFDGDIVFDEEVKVSLVDESRVGVVSKSLAPKQAIGESIGIERIRASTSHILFAELGEMMDDPTNWQE